MHTYLRLLRQPGFRNLFVGLLISRLGDGVANIVITWTVWEQTAAPGLVGLSLLAGMLPPLLFSFLAGVVADRFVHKHLMAISDIARMALLLVAAWLTWADALGPLRLMLLSFLLSAFSTLFAPARAAAMSKLLPPEHVQAANGLMSGTFIGATMIGALIGGWLLPYSSAAGLLLLDAVTFGASLAGVMMMPTTRSATTGRRSTVYADASQGIATILRSPALLWVVGTFGIGTFLAGGIVKVGTTVLMDRLGAGAQGLGTLNLAMGVGIIAGSLWAGRIRTDHRPRLVMAAWLASGALLLLLGASTQLWMALAVAFAEGLCTSFINVPTEALLQLHGGENTGKVYSLWSISIQVGEVTSLLVVTPLYAHLPLAWVFALCGSGLMLASIIGLGRCWSLRDQTLPNQTVA